MKCRIRPLISADECFLGCASVFTEYAEKDFGTEWAVGDGGVFLRFNPNMGDEGYRLIIEDNVASLFASTKKGMHNGLADLLSRLSESEGLFITESADVSESPDCSYRGVMLDLARQWHPLPYLLSYRDLCWKNRASHFQLHFTDFQSFTLPVNAFPRLSTEGRCYTRNEIKTLVGYADARGIVLVPEVDVPGHTTQFFVKYPEIFGNNGVLPACDEVFCALRKIFSEVIEMFPNSPMIHIGGDEANINSWLNCERTQNYMKTHGISDVKEMYAEYIRILTDTVLEMGRTPVVWEGFSKEFNDRIDKRTIVSEFESLYQPAYDLAESGFTLINCSWKPLYIVTPNTHWTPEEIAALDPWKWDHWWEKSVAYPNGYRVDRKYPVLGEQICAWGDAIAGWDNWEDGIIKERELVAERLPAMCKKLWRLGM